MRVLGVDPGLRVTGYGAVDCAGVRPQLIEAGVITPDTKAPLERRLGELCSEMRAVIAVVRPDVMVIEELWTSYKNPTTAVLMGHARGVLCLAAHQEGVAVRHLAHASVKRALTGAGGARKDQVNRMVVTLLRLTTIPEPNDVSDALALALAHANIAAVERGLARAVTA